MPLAALDPAAVAKNPACFNVIYPVKPDSTFNMDYYLKTHMPLVQKVWGPVGLKSWKVYQIHADSGYEVQAFLEFESVGAMHKALQDQEQVQSVMSDVPNFSNQKPLTLIGAQVGSS